MDTKNETANTNEPLEAGDTATTERRLQSLPSDAISAILNHCSDFASILNLGETNAALRVSIYHQNWTCRHCRHLLFVDADLSTDKYADPFICAVCRSKLCGESVDYDRRFCRPQKCDGCGKVECHKCLTAHMGTSDGYGTENYCEECQAEFEFGMGGC